MQGSLDHYALIMNVERGYSILYRRLNTLSSKIKYLNILFFVLGERRILESQNVVQIQQPLGVCSLSLVEFCSFIFQASHLSFKLRASLLVHWAPSKRQAIKHKRKE